MKIGELAGRTGLSPSRIRYYEQRGLLPSPSRRNNGYRDFSEDDITVLQFIQNAKSLGFSLREISEALARKDPADRLTELIGLLEQKVAEIEAQISASKRLKTRLLSVLTAQRNCDLSSAR